MIGQLPPYAGGIGYYCLRQVESLARFMEVDVISFSSPYPAFLYKGHPGKGERIQSRNRMRISYLLKWYNPLTWVLAGIKPRSRIVHVHWWSIYLLPLFFTVLVLAKLRGKRIVCTVHTLLEHDERNVVDILLRKMFFKIPDVIIVHSPENKKTMVETFGMRESKIAIIPMGIFDMYGKGVDKQKARNYLGISKKTKVILDFGQIRKYKGVEDLLRAFQYVKSRIADSKLVIVGKAWIDWKPFQESIQESGLEKDIMTRIEFIPSSEVKYYFSAADVVVLPYKKFESQSAIGTIGLSFGKPLLVTDVGGLKNLVSDERAITKAGNPLQMGKKIVALLQNESLLKKLASDSRVLRREFSWERIAQKTVNLYKRLQ